MAYCTECGNRMKAADKFCTKCGAQVVQNPVAAPNGRSNIETPRTINRTTPTLAKWVYFAIAAAVLFFTNPTKLDFYAFARGEVISRYGPSEEDSTPILNNLMVGIISNALTESTIRNDYLVFSTYTVDLRGLQLFKGDIPAYFKFIGVFGQFFPL